MLTEHAGAILALLEADPNLTVFDGGDEIPALTEPPYVVMWLSIDTERSDRLCGDTDRTALRITTHSVATKANGARIVADRVRDALLDSRLTVVGWKPWPIKHEFGIPPDSNEQAGTDWISTVDGWTLSTTPAA